MESLFSFTSRPVNQANDAPDAPIASAAADTPAAFAKVRRENEGPLCPPSRKLSVVMLMLSFHRTREGAQVGARSSPVL